MYFVVMLGCEVHRRGRGRSAAATVVTRSRVLLMEARRRAAAWGPPLVSQERVMGPSRRRDEPNQKMVRTVVVPGRVSDVMGSVGCWAGERTDVAHGCRAEPASGGESKYHERDGYLDEPETDNLHQTVYPEQVRPSLLFSSSAIGPSSSLTLHDHRNHQINQNTRLQ